MTSERPKGGDPIAEPAADPVTGACPRALLEPRLEHELSRAVRTGGRCALFLFDLDFFKTVNDVYGHLRGDQVLRQFAERIGPLARRHDVLFRYGGDEFVLLLPDTGRDEAIRLGELLTAAVRDDKFPGDPPLQLSVSLGIATYPEDGTDPASVLGRADRRTYLAKRRGRDRAVADDADLSAEPATSRLWERDAALAAVQAFLTRLLAERRGALRVTGPRGAGHTRFLTEITKIAKLRGLTVLPVPPVPEPLPEPPARSGAGFVLLADRGTADRLAAAIDHLGGAGGAPPVIGAVVVTPTASAGRGEPTDPAVPAAGGVQDTVELLPWTPAAVRICVRTKLGGEPSRTLVNWLTGQTGGLPGRVVRELDRLRDRNAVVATDAEGWTVAPEVLGRPRRRVRLPAPMGRLIGRERELERVAGLLAAGRLVTLVGPGGIGKTRLSLAVAAAAADEFAEGVVFVPLADTSSPELVLAAVTRALDLGQVPGQPLLDTLVDHLAEASLLLVLDNFEQVLSAGPAVGQLLAAAPAVAVLVTSREPVDLYGEQVYRVPPLPLPGSDRLLPGESGVARVLAESPAVALFDQRARAVNADFVLSPATLPAVVGLCRRLDGLPLAIELAAARTAVWSPQALLDRLVGHLDALGTGPRDRPERQQTLRGAIGWSYHLLGPDEQRLFRTLAVFVGGVTAEAALAVAGLPAGLPARLPGGQPGGRPGGEPDPLAGVAAGLASLAAKSLLVEQTEGAGVRYRMLETIRAYAADQLADDPAAAAVSARHADHYVTFAEQAGEAMAGPDQAEWADRLEHDYQNLRAATEWALGTGDPAGAARVCLGLWRYWRTGSHLAEGRDWLARVVASRADGLPDGTRARLLHAAAVLAGAQDEHELAGRLAAESLTLAEAAGDPRTTAQARNAAGIAAIGAGDYPAAAGHFRHSLAIFRELAEPHGTAVALGNLAKLALRVGDVAAASGYIDECLGIERATGNTFGITLGLETLARILLARGDLPAARAALDESLALSRTLGDVYGEAMALHQFGLTAQAAGESREALRLLTDALTRRQDLDDREDLAISLDCVANLVAERDPALATRLLGAADRLRERYRLPVPSEGETRREATLAAVRAALDQRAFGTAWTAGRGTPLDLVIDQVIDLAGG